MPAWEITKTWSSEEIAAYRTYVAKEGPQRVSYLRATCEDLALLLVIHFAEREGLPVGFTNGAHPRGLTPENFATKAEFLDTVLTSTAADDLLRYKTVRLVPGASTGDPSSLSLADRGDLIILYGGHHVQVVTSATATTVTIAQGNFRDEAERCGVLSRLWDGNNQNRPSDDCYIGEIVRQRWYSHDADADKWEYSGDNPDVFSDRGRLSIWDFDAWNDLIIVHQVMQDESLSTIARSYYGDGNQWKRVYDSNRSTVGNNPDLIRPGQTLYLWKKKIDREYQDNSR